MQGVLYLRYGDGHPRDGYLHTVYWTGGQTAIGYGVKYSDSCGKYPGFGVPVGTC